MGIEILSISRRKVGFPPTCAQIPAQFYPDSNLKSFWQSRIVRFANATYNCGTKICREKGIEYARRLLGHANISTTQRYMHLDERELAEAQDLVE
jgi:hypothetical protein